MTGWGKRIVVGLWIVIAVEVAIVAWWYGFWGTDAFLGVAPGGNLSKPSVDAAQALVMISAVAIGIERAIEYLWSASSMAVGSFWPVSAVGKFVTDLSDDVGRTFAPHLEHAQSIVKALKDAEQIGLDKAEELQQRLASAETQLGELKKQVKSSQGALTFASAAADVANNVSVEFQAFMDNARAGEKDPVRRQKLARAMIKAQASLAARRANAGTLKGAELDAAAEQAGEAAAAAWEATFANDEAARDLAVANVVDTNPFAIAGNATAALSTSIGSVTDFLASFKDNPGRRLLSLELGIIAGLVIALFTGLDVFAGVANEGATAPGGEAAEPVLAVATIGGVMFTGILMGLGSSPTHEVIRVLQESKKARKAATAPEVEEHLKDAGTDVAGGGGAGPAGFAAGPAAPQARAPRTLIRVR